MIYVRPSSWANVYQGAEWGRRRTAAERPEPAIWGGSQWESVSGTIVWVQVAW
ncbi:hypothetical protein Cs7R123_68180 [Catellatospora sp. TT07R-123]|nr:hypothetical protein Cs7R123_68180 [Catellatospora sp. TT07R-123]